MTMKVPSIIHIQLVAFRRLLVETKEQFCFAVKSIFQRIFWWVMSLSLFSWIYITMQNLMIKALSVGPIPEHVSFITVSYTHLDVYKRQIQRPTLQSKS